MLDATGLPRGSAVRCNIVAIYSNIALYSKRFKNTTPNISRGSSVRGALDLESKGCWFEHTVRHYFSYNNVRLLA